MFRRFEKQYEDDRVVRISPCEKISHKSRCGFFSGRSGPAIGLNAAIARKRFFASQWVEKLRQRFKNAGLTVTLVLNRLPKSRLPPLPGSSSRVRYAGYCLLWRRGKRIPPTPAEWRLMRIVFGCLVALTILVAGGSAASADPVAAGGKANVAQKSGGKHGAKRSTKAKGSTGARRKSPTRRLDRAGSTKMPAPSSMAHRLDAKSSRWALFARSAGCPVTRLHSTVGILSPLDGLHIQLEKLRPLIGLGFELLVYLLLAFVFRARAG